MSYEYGEESRGPGAIAAADLGATRNTTSRRSRKIADKRRDRRVRASEAQQSAFAARRQRLKKRMAQRQTQMEQQKTTAKVINRLKPDDPGQTVVAGKTGKALVPAPTTETTTTTVPAPPKTAAPSEPADITITSRPRGLPEAGIVPGTPPVQPSDSPGLVEAVDELQAAQDAQLQQELFAAELEAKAAQEQRGISPVVLAAGVVGGAALLYFLFRRK